MRPLLSLTVANIRSFTRDRAALFWTMAFPLIFILLFGSIFTGGGSTTFKLGWVDLDGSTTSAQLRTEFARVSAFTLTDGDEPASLAAMGNGDLDGVIVVPAGFAAQVGQTGLRAAASPAMVQVYTDPSQTTTSATIQGIADQVLAGVDQALTGRTPAMRIEARSAASQQFSFISYLVPSILGMAVMQLGIFSAVPLVADRQKQILKRLNATPLRRWQLVGSNVLMRLLLSLVQAVIVIAVGSALFNVQVGGNPLAIAGLVLLGSLMFISLGYVIASFAQTEDAANAMTSIVQFPLMFLSGTFFPIAEMPSSLQTVARALPLTYLGDALRQVMVGGAPFTPLWICVAVLAAWLVACFGFAARTFRWQ
jgi:ABC-2 type transport system permease protein